tara:strand:- start:144 stop:560 length:417 start_codon:yes stop_codon:yes gene_type:complete
MVLVNLIFKGKIMNFVQAVKSYFIRWNDFKGRSSRSEYWWATLFTYLVIILLQVVQVMLVQAESVLALLAMITILVFLLFLTIASFAVMVRRLHDVNRSGWWFLIYFTIIGIFVLLYWYVQKGDEADNRYGSDPLSGL